LDDSKHQAREKHQAWMEKSAECDHLQAEIIRLEDACQAAQSALEEQRSLTVTASHTSMASERDLQLSQEHANAIERLQQQLAEVDHQRAATDIQLQGQTAACAALEADVLPLRQEVSHCRSEHLPALAALQAQLEHEREVSAHLPKQEDYQALQAALAAEKAGHAETRHAMLLKGEQHTRQLSLMQAKLETMSVQSRKDKASLETVSERARAREHESESESGTPVSAKSNGPVLDPKRVRALLVEKDSLIRKLREQLELEREGHVATGNVLRKLRRTSSGGSSGILSVPPSPGGVITGSQLKVKPSMEREKEMERERENAEASQAGPPTSAAARMKAFLGAVVFWMMFYGMLAMSVVVLLIVASGNMSAHHRRALLRAIFAWLNLPGDWWDGPNPS